MKLSRRNIFILIATTVLLVGLAFCISKYCFESKSSSYPKGSAEEIAESYVKENSRKGLEFTLTKDFDNGTFVKFYVNPSGKDAGTADEARIFLKKDSSGYEVIGFGTAFPHLEEQYPELKGEL